MVRPGSFIFKLLPAPCAMSRRVFRGARAVAGLPRDACARNPTRPHPTIVVTVLVTVVENKVREAFAPPPTAYVPSPAPVEEQLPAPYVPPIVAAAAPPPSAAPGPAAALGQH